MVRRYFADAKEGTKGTQIMFLLWLSVSLPTTMVLGLGRINTNDLLAVKFAAKIRGRKLIGEVIEETKVDSEDICQWQCVDESRCLSYNFGPAEGGKTFKCQLSDSDRFAAMENFTQDDEFSYRGIKSACEGDSFQCGKKEICIPNYKDGSARCKCDDGYAGKPCRVRSCFQLFLDGLNSSGVFTVNPDGGKAIQVLCDMKTDGGGWTVLQRRLDGSIDFYLGWESYQKGFGNLNGEFWLGNDNIHRFTAADDVMLRVDLEDFDGKVTYAKYMTFKVEEEAAKYRLLIGGYRGTAGDSMIYHSNMRFSTKDQDNDLRSMSNCAQHYKGAWWYKNCHRSNMKGLYLTGPHASFADGVNWKTFRGHHYSLKRTEMRVKTKV